MPLFRVLALLFLPASMLGQLSTPLVPKAEQDLSQITTTLAFPVISPDDTSSDTRRLSWHQLDTAAHAGVDWKGLLRLQHKRVSNHGYLEVEADHSVVLRSQKKGSSMPGLTIHLAGIDPEQIIPGTWAKASGLFHMQPPLNGEPHCTLTDVDLTPAPTEPVDLPWDSLRVEMTDVYIESLDAYYWKPQFEPRHWEMDGAFVRITGYAVWIDAQADFFMLSKYPDRGGCCWMFDPREVMDLRDVTQEEMPRNNQRIVVEGMLRLNPDDLYQMNYILNVTSLTTAPDKPKKD